MITANYVTSTLLVLVQIGIELLEVVCSMPREELLLCCYWIVGVGKLSLNNVPDYKYIYIYMSECSLIMYLFIIFMYRCSKFYGLLIIFMFRCSRIMWSANYIYVPMQ